ncbi:MAG TPA: hypothetical protein VH741_00380, partial [Candidatus Limnocylindrales bacterium]
HFGVLVASALVPVRLDWRRALAPLPHLQRQLHWVYGGYTALAIVAFGTLSLLNAGELAGGSLLARSLCAYMALFWAIRLALQRVLDVEAHLGARWLRLGYHALTVVFAFFVVVFSVAAFGSGR